MSSRKQTIDGLDDVDDEDGALEEENSQETDLTLVVESAEEAITGSASRDDNDLDEGESDEEER
jgi:hypothetical protein